MPVEALHAQCTAAGVYLNMHCRHIWYFWIPRGRAVAVTCWDARPAQVCQIAQFSLDNISRW